MSSPAPSPQQLADKRDCDNCGRAADLAEQYCRACGHEIGTEPNGNVSAEVSIEATKQCPHCAETIKADANLCRYCGSNLTAEAGVPSESEPRKESLSGGNVLAALVMPFLGLIVAVFYLLKPQSRERGMTLVVVSLISWVVWWVVCSMTGGF